MVLEEDGQLVDVSPSPVTLHKSGRALLSQSSVKKSPRASKTTAGKGARQAQQGAVMAIKLKGALPTSSATPLPPISLVTSSNMRQNMDSETSEQLPFLPTKDIYDSSSSDGEDKNISMPALAPSLQPVSLQYGHESMMWTPSISSSSSSESD